MFWTWTLVAVVGVGLAALGAGLWWALADFLLDLGSPVADWDTASAGRGRTPARGTGAEL